MALKLDQHAGQVGINTLKKCIAVDSAEIIQGFMFIINNVLRNSINEIFYDFACDDFNFYISK